MILSNAPQNEAIVSNVGEIGEFRIRNSAKAFSILSSGLYANKIRAIIRELSCNAVDSHAAANKKDVPFDVHLPNTLEPYFSIRDYGTGLSHDQVTNIYTTYFESTKTASNEFIGALGLGSKSPFSYTDNFTVTAIKDGRKGIYTAFINEQGVPSIALMMEEATDEPAGVEVKFAVADQYEFDRFRQEAREVYKYFALRPVVTGNSDFRFENVEYDTKNIIPGVHSYKQVTAHSAAIMGNIAYPINIPSADQALGNLRTLLACGLEIHFDIGELDFQASREGLSYIPQTVDAIKRKLEALNVALTQVLAREADAISNLWDRAVFLARKKEHKLWSNSVMLYANQHNIPTFDHQNRYGARCATFSLKVEDLAKNWNIQIKQLVQTRISKAIGNGKPSIEYAENNAKDANGQYIKWSAWNIVVDPCSHFVINDLKTGAGERTRYHYRETELAGYHSRNIWILEKVDKTKDMNLKAFFAATSHPPENRVLAASGLRAPERKIVDRNISILRLERRGGSGYRLNDKDMVWRDAGDTSKFADTDMHGNPLIYYYVPLNGFIMQSSKGYTSGKELYEDVKCLPSLYSGDIYGVRKKDIEEIKKRKNWKNFEDHISQVLATRDLSKVMASMVIARLDHSDILKYNNKVILSLLEDAASPYAKFVKQFAGVSKFEGDSYRVGSVLKKFAPNVNFDLYALIAKFQGELNEVNRRYPLLCKMRTSVIDSADIAEYINMCDAKKGKENGKKEEV